jgi:hypothetical protein
MVLAAVDLRKDRSVAIEPQELQDRLLLSSGATIVSSRRPRNLTAQGYAHVVYADSNGDVDSIAAHGLAEPKPERIKSLGPDPAR